MSPQMQKWASVGERIGRVALTAFIGVLVTTGGDLANLTVLRAAVSAGIAAALDAALSLLGGNTGNTSTPSLLPARWDPATGVATITSLPEQGVYIAANGVAGYGNPAAEQLLKGSRRSLGRIVNHDPESLRYAVPETAGPVKAVKWTRRAPVFDQGQVGSCTGNAAAGWLGYDDATRVGYTTVSVGGKVLPVDEKLALLIYSAAEVVDGDGPYPPQDNGSSGLSVAKVLKTDGLASGYTHAFSITALYTALQSGPVMVGIPWLNSMFDTDSDGQIIYTKSSGVAGGHEFIIDELEVDASGTVTKIWMCNSWGTSWGIAGRGYFTPAALAALLAQQGDITAPVPIALPAPTPTPVPVPVPVPVPTPAPSADPFLAEVAVYPHLGPELARLALAKGMTEEQYAAWRLASATHTLA